MADEKAVLPDVQGDRVAGLSISKDGTPDQHNPTLIGDRETILAQTREQLRQQAASNAGREADRQAAGGELPPQDVEDPTIAKAQQVKDDAVKAADAAAESIVGALFSDEVQSATPASDVPASDATTGPAKGRRAASGGTEQ
jgi:hypothetical protein